MKISNSWYLSLEDASRTSGIDQDRLRGLLRQHGTSFGGLIDDQYVVDLLALARHLRGLPCPGHPSMSAVAARLRDAADEIEDGDPEGPRTAFTIALAEMLAWGDVINWSKEGSPKSPDAESPKQNKEL